MADGIVESLWAQLREPLRAELRVLIAEELARALAVPRPTPVLTTDQLASVLGVSSKTIQRLRGDGLTPLMVGDSPRYELERVLTFLRQRAAVATSEGLKLVKGGAE